MVRNFFLVSNRKRVWFISGVISIVLLGLILALVDWQRFWQIVGHINIFYVFVAVFLLLGEGAISAFPIFFSPAKRRNFIRHFVPVLGTVCF